MNLFCKIRLKLLLLLIGMMVACLDGLLAAPVDNVQNGDIKITGFVYSTEGEALPGATIRVEGTTRGVLTDVEGAFSVEVKLQDRLTASYLGYEPQTITVKKQGEIRFMLAPQANELDVVTVVAFGKQKKESVISSVSTIKPAELKMPSSNMTTVLGGRIAGVISRQSSGEPGRDNSEFFIRGVTTFNEYARGPLILIDNVELTTDDLARLQPDDIASFSIMKDATATALYGARGANGVVLVTTKEGKEGPAKLNVRFENSFSTPVSRVKTVDPITYMRLHNEAVQTRNPLTPRPYSDKKIESTERGGNPYVYPAVDWYDEMFKNFTSNQRVNLNVSGGGNVARYYVAGTFNNDNGVLKSDSRNKFDNNINLRTIQLRSNTNINVTKTTQMNVRFSGTFEDYSGPIDSGDDLYKKVMAANPVLFPVSFPSQENSGMVNRIQFGNYGDGSWLNPYAEMTRGYKEYSRMVLVAQIELKEKLDYITKGLGARIMGSTTRSSYFDVNRFYKPAYYAVSSYDPLMDTYTLTNLNPDDAQEFLEYNEGSKNISTNFYLEAALDYNRTFADKHAVSGLLVYTVRNELLANQGTLQKSLPYRNMGLSGRFTYGYDQRYFAEFNFGYNGSERFAKNERFGFFPSVGTGWIVSNEKFWNKELSDVVNLLKLKATYGLVGNDAIGSANDRFFYLSNVNMKNKNGNMNFGENLDNHPYVVTVSQYGNDKITWETARKLNLGFELGLFNDLTLQFDYFREKRENILMTRESVPSTMGLQAALRANVGEAKSHGYEIMLDYNHSFNKDMWLSAQGNFTYATGEYEKYEEPDYGYPWLSHVGMPIGQPTGLIAERLFVDEADIANSPVQSFGPVMPGDIKYKDINGDDVINDLDVVPIGYPEIPNIVVGFGASFGYKGFDFSFFFQGAAQSSFFIDSKKTSPFINMKSDQVIGKNSNNAMLQAWADSHWSESNRNSYALWPRLSDELIENNQRRSTWYLYDGSYLRLKSLEIGYTLPGNLTKKFRMSELRFYLSGLNLFTLSKFKLWDPEMGSNGLGYPIQRVYNIGINVNF